MKISKLQLVTSDLSYIVGYLEDHMSVEYAYTDSNTVIFTPKFTLDFLIKTHLNVVILKQKSSYIEVEIIEEKSSKFAIITNLLNQNFTKKVSNVLNRYCDEFIVNQKTDFEAALV